MEKENTSIRLKKIMSDRNLRQVDILELCKPYCQKYGVKLGRNDLSQYVTGKVEPGQRKLTILGMALNVNEAWLMGYDVPMERSTPEGFKKWAGHFNDTHKQYTLNTEEQKIIDNMRNQGLTAKDERDIKKDLDSLMEKLSSKEYGPAAYDGEDIPEDDQELFAGQLELMLRRLKAINKEKYNPNKNKK